MTILLTKVRPPQRRKDVLRRVRLIDALHQNLHRKLTFVSAPAGYGKTTLLVDFADDVDAIVCWYRISPEDNDIVQFARHLLAAFQQQVPNFGPELGEKLSSPGGSPDAASLAIDFINEVEQKVGDFCLLVLDDYHLAGENQHIVDFIENFLEHLPDHLRILIGSRSVYGIPTASLYIRDELVTIGADELRFRADELQRLVLQNHRIRLSDEQAEEFAKRADGWIIAILLALRTMENGVLPRFSGGIEQVYKYLAEEVVSRQSADLRNFMMATSILGDFNKQLCDFLLERNDTDELLRSLEERNLFVSRTDTLEGPSYRYHQLFSEFLQDYFARTNKPQLQALHRRAAEWHRGRFEWEPAIEHKLASGDKQEAASWMDGAAGQFYTSGRQMLLARWVKSLQKAPDFRKEAPHLLLYEAKMLGTQGQFPASLKLLNLAEPALSKLEDIDAIANAQITRGMISRFTGKYSEALKLAEKAQALLGDDPRPALRQKWFQAERLKSIPLFFMGKPDEAVETLEKAANGLRHLVGESDAATRTLYLYDLAECLNDLGFLQITLGRMLDAQKAFQETLEIHLSIHSNLGALATARNNIAYLHHQIGQYAEAWHEYSLALEHARSSNQARWQIGILNGRAELLLDVDEKEEAFTSLQQALMLGEETGEKPGMVATYMGLARAERQREHYQEAMNWLRKAASISSGGLDGADYKVELGRIYADMGQPNLALQQFEATIQEWPTEKAPTQAQVLAAYLAARTKYRSGKEQPAGELLTMALEGAAQLGYDQFLVAASRTCLDFLNHFASDSSPQLKTLISRASKFTTGKAALETSAPDVEIQVSYMEVRAFGPGDIRKNGEVLPTTAWRSSRARALFFYILDKQRVRKDVIGLEFWPDFSTGKISSNFHATLWRVRQALGFKESILFENDHYSLHPSLQVWYDVHEFESQLAKAKDASLSRRERTELSKQAIELYKQPYLADVYIEWADRRREELRNLYLDALIDLANLETSGERYREAKLLYEKILEVDPYRDEVHLALMKNLVESGAPSSAMAHFKGYRELLRKELNAEPLFELQAYYDQLAVSIRKEN
jgi:LuxR family maltose regulon positive regulatory protein